MAMRSSWSGSLGFGLVNIPVKLYNAVTRPETAGKTHNVHLECKTQLQQPKWCPACERKVEATEIGKAYEYGKDQLIELTAEDLKSLPLESGKSLNVIGFMEAEGLTDYRLFDEVYFIGPAELKGNAPKAFTLFLKAMAEMEVVGIAKVAFRDKEHLCAIRPGSGVMMLQTLNWVENLRDPSEIAISAPVSEKEMDLAKQLIGSMTKDIDLDSFKDEYSEALIKLIETKLMGGNVAALAPAAPKTESDLVGALMASLGQK